MKHKSNCEDKVTLGKSGYAGKDKMREDARAKLKMDIKGISESQKLKSGGSIFSKAKQGIKSMLGMAGSLSEKARAGKSLSNELSSKISSVKEKALGASKLASEKIEGMSAAMKNKGIEKKAMGGVAKFRLQQMDKVGKQIRPKKARTSQAPKLTKKRGV